MSWGRRPGRTLPPPHPDSAIHTRALHRVGKAEVPPDELAEGSEVIAVLATARRRTDSSVAEVAKGRGHDVLSCSGDLYEHWPAAQAGETSGQVHPAAAPTTWSTEETESPWDRSDHSANPRDRDVVQERQPRADCTKANPMERPGVGRADREQSPTSNGRGEAGSTDTMRACLEVPNGRPTDS